MPASASPSVTLANTLLTSTSVLAGSAVMWSCSRSAAATLPHGAVSTQTTYFTPLESRSANRVRFAGLSLGGASTITLVAKVFGVVDKAVFALSIVVVSAVARTSAGAPPAACWAKVAEESNASLTFTPECSFSNWVARSVNVPVRDDAASTVIVVSSLLPQAVTDAAAVTRTAGTPPSRRNDSGTRAAKRPRLTAGPAAGPFSHAF